LFKSLEFRIDSISSSATIGFLLNLGASTTGFSKTIFFFLRAKPYFLSVLFFNFLSSTDDLVFLISIASFSLVVLFLVLGGDGLLGFSSFSLISLAVLFLVLGGVGLGNSGY
jgi:hypothetical protein